MTMIAICFVALPYVAVLCGMVHAIVGDIQRSQELMFRVGGTCLLHDAMVHV